MIYCYAARCAMSSNAMSLGGSKPLCKQSWEMWCHYASYVAGAIQLCRYASKAEQCQECDAFEEQSCYASKAKWYQECNVEKAMPLCSRTKTAMRAKLSDVKWAAKCQSEPQSQAHRKGKQTAKSSKAHRYRASRKIEQTIKSSEPQHERSWSIPSEPPKIERNWSMLTLLRSKRSDAKEWHAAMRAKLLSDANRYRARGNEKLRSARRTMWCSIIRKCILFLTSLIFDMNIDTGSQTWQKNAATNLPIVLLLSYYQFFSDFVRRVASAAGSCI